MTPKEYIEMTPSKPAAKLPRPQIICDRAASIIDENKITTQARNRTH